MLIEEKENSHVKLNYTKKMCSNIQNYECF